MAGSSSDESEASRSIEGISKGIASMLPPSFDTHVDDDDDNDDSGLDPSELYGKYTWMISKFSQIDKQELRSNVFEIGGYKWHITIYPKGIDVSDHLSLFLCVANHDKLVEGWSQFAQFTISIVNKDLKKSKYSDTLHRFWEKEHDWGWRRFMEISRLSDGFVDDDTLVIKAQVQVIREKRDRPFPCLDYQYRRELLRVYLSNLETLCRRFVEEKRGRFRKLIEDKVRWSSFCNFWSGFDQNSRDQMSQENSDSVLTQIVKYFFIEKEVTSTLVMDSLYIGLTALKEPSMRIVRMDKGSFILVDDLLLLIEREAMKPLAQKDGHLGEFYIEREAMEPMAPKEGDAGEFSVESGEKRLAELGRRTIEIYVMGHILSKMEVAYQKAVPCALKLQE